jgi:hypothetical protein
MSDFSVRPAKSGLPVGGPAARLHCGNSVVQTVGSTSRMQTLSQKTRLAEQSGGGTIIAHPTLASMVLSSARACGVDASNGFGSSGG